MQIVTNNTPWNLLVATLAFACLTQVAQGQERAAWRFAVGEPLRYEVVQSSIVTVDAGPSGSFTTNSTQTLDVEWRFDRVDDDGVGHGVQEITRLQVQVTMPEGLELKYDSATDETPEGVAAMLTTLYSAILEFETSIAVAPTGDLVQFDPPAEMLEKLSSVPATRAMSDMVVDVGLRSTAESIALRLSGRAETPRKFEFANRVLGNVRGELAWVETTQANNPAFKHYSPQLKLNIEPASESDVSGESVSRPRPLSDPKIESQAIEGDAVFNIEAGRLESSKHTVKLNVEGELAGNHVTSKLEQTAEIRHVSDES